MPSQLVLLSLGDRKIKDKNFGCHFRQQLLENGGATSDRYFWKMAGVTSDNNFWKMMVSLQTTISGK